MYIEATIKAGDYLGIMKFGLRQLEAFQTEGNTTNYLKRDIKGYNILINSEFPQENCKAFIKLKKQAKEAGAKFDDNLILIEYMKNNKIWEGL